jgi:hypothetical protein
MAKDQSTTKTPLQSFASHEIQRKEIQTRDMRDHDKILTVDPRGTRGRRSEHVKDSISGFHVSRLGVTRISI